MTANAQVLPLTQPISFVPYLRPVLWGGRNLARYGKSLPPGMAVGESWEVSGHPLHVSRLDSDSPPGASLSDLWAGHASHWTAGEYDSSEPFPLLVKLLDCRLPCSVQVHPNQAASTDSHQHVKTEAWTVVEASTEGRVYAGLKAGVTENDLREALDAGTVLDCLHAVEPHVGDCFLITPGTVHTMQGVVLAEFQTTSDATLRLYDWDRLDGDGRKREIHIEESLAAIDWSRGPVDPVLPRPLITSSTNVSSEALVEIPEFQLTRHTITGAWKSERSDIFSIWMLVSGDASLSLEGSAQTFDLHAGKTLLIPPHRGINLDCQGRQPAVFLQCDPPL